MFGYVFIDTWFSILSFQFIKYFMAKTTMTSFFCSVLDVHVHVHLPWKEAVLKAKLAFIKGP